MSLPPRTRVGSYEVTAALGAGGMGQVYRAHDTRLGRDVALKILPDAFATDPDRLARFEREAQVLASLNHPNIAAIYGFEDALSTGPGQAAIRALVLELVDGETLADRIAHGPVPLAEALPIARQIAEALEAAHEQGIVHRDLKPANVKVRPDGTVKVLDFGLAKLAQAGIQGSMPDPSQSPTITTPAMTRAGVILGTAAYMSPQQATGKAVDARADIWAFGCVLFEMLTGRRAFEGEGVADTLARVLERDPDWTWLPATVTPALRTYLTRCLQKDPRQRVQAIGDVRLALDGAFEASLPPTAAPVAVTGWRRVAGLAAALTAGGAIVGSLTWVAMRQPPPRVSRLQVASSGDSEPSVGYNDRDLAITPDGSRLVYIGNRGTQIFVRPLDALVPMAVHTGRRATGLFVSPDGQWIGFTDGGVLKKVAVSGGPAVTVARRDTSVPSGATWGPDDTIIFATENPATGLQRVSASGGSLDVLTRPDPARGEADHAWPEMLPGGRHVLFTITALTGGLGAAQVAVLDLQTRTYRVVLRGGSHAHYVPSGHLVYGDAGALRAVAFDLARLEVRGVPVTVVPDVVTSNQGVVDAVVSRDGTLAYLSAGGVGGAPRTLVWVDRQGRETPIAAPPRPYFLPSLSPDGTRVAVFANDQEGDIWLVDLGRTTLTRLTVVPGRDVVQVWTPDSRRLIFGSERAGGRNVFWQAADGTGTVERLTESANTQYPTGVSPDGRQLIFSEETSQTSNDLMEMALDGTRRVTPLLQSQFTERNGTISPDGRWLAYEANDSGPFEIYVRPYPDVNSGRWVVSAGGGTKPIWTRSGQELIYVAPSGALMRVGVESGSSWAATTASVVVREGYFTNPLWWGRSYDVSADGQRFLMIKEGGLNGTAPVTSLVVVQHWVEELTRLVPTP